VSRLRRIPLLVWIIVPIAFAALLAWPLGGWDTVKLVSRTLPEYDSGQVLHGHRLDIAIGDAWLTDTHPVYGPPDEGDDEEYLVVEITVTNVTREYATSSVLRDYIAPEVDGLDTSSFSTMDTVLTLDDSTLPEFNPGLSRDLELVYTITPGALTAGDDLRIDLNDAKSRASFIGYGQVWDTFPAGYAIRAVGQR
jgi:hypothetical protein